jgi:hypothetical protein
MYTGQIQKWLPGSKQECECELWHIEYDDGDEEDVDTHDMVRMLV